MAEILDLEELGRLVMGASVKAEFLGLRRIVDGLDQVFSDIVREAMEEKERQVSAAVREAALGEEDV